MDDCQGDTVHSERPRHVVEWEIGLKVMLSVATVHERSIGSGAVEGLVGPWQKEQAHQARETST